MDSENPYTTFCYHCCSFNHHLRLIRILVCEKLGLRDSDLY